MASVVEASADGRSLRLSCGRCGSESVHRMETLHARAQTQCSTCGTNLELRQGEVERAQVASCFG